MAYANEHGRIAIGTCEVPESGWVCFHCGERFTTPGSAQDHFGANPSTLTACQIKAGEERGLLMELRRVEKDREFLWDLLDSIDTASDMAKGNDKHYRAIVQRLQAKRGEIGDSLDGQTITWKNTGKLLVPGVSDTTTGPEPLSDASIQEIHCGLRIPNEKAIVSMSREIRKWRGMPNPDLI